MNIKDMKAETKKEELARVVYVKQSQIDSLNSYNEKHGMSFKWNSEEEQKMFFEDKQIPFEDIEGWVPFLCLTNNITYLPKTKNYIFPMQFGNIICNMYAFDSSVAVDDEVEEYMKKIKEEQVELPF